MIGTIDTQRCVRCGLCIQDCIADAIDPDTMVIDQHRCIRCSHCSAICPVVAVSWHDALGNPMGAGEPVEPVSDSTVQELENLILRRRSVRSYHPEPLPAPLLQRLLETVNHAPTGTNSRGVGVTVVNSPQRMRELSDLAMRFFGRLGRLVLNPVTVPWILLLGGRTGLRKLRGYQRHIDRYFEGHNNLTHGAPALLVFHADRRSSCPSEDALIWAATAALHAESLGLGTCYNGFLVRAARLHRPIRRWLDLPRGHRVYETLLIGSPRVQYPRAACREPSYTRIIE